MARPGYRQPPSPIDLPNPFPPEQANLPGYPLSRREYGSDSEIGDPYGSRTRLADSTGFYDGEQYPRHQCTTYQTCYPGRDSGSDNGHRSYAGSVESHSTSHNHSNYMEPVPTEQYQAWSSDRQIPMSTEEIEDIFLDLTQKFGFQRDSMRNMVSDVPCNSERSVLMIMS
jgi:1,3-beta-glucan synthase